MEEKIGERFGGRKGTKESTEECLYFVEEFGQGLLTRASGGNRITEPYLMEERLVFRSAAEEYTRKNRYLLYYVRHIIKFVSVDES